MSKTQNQSQLQGKTVVDKVGKSRTNYIQNPQHMKKLKQAQRQIIVKSR